MDFLDLNNSRIRYSFIDGDTDGDTDGNTDRPYLVFLHEGLGCIEMWKDFPERLCRRTGCPGLLYDRQGYGQSSPLTQERDIGYVHAYAREELAPLLDALIGNHPFILVGHSDGASVALIYGSSRNRYKPLLRGIISEAAHVFVEDVTIAGIREAYNHYQDEGVPRLIKYHGDKTETIFKAWAEVWLSDWFRAWNFEDLLPGVTCPVLAIQGAADAYGTAKQVEVIVSRTTGPAEPLLIENCGHAPHVECPDIVLTAMQDFIERCIENSDSVDP